MNRVALSLLLTASLGIAGCLGDASYDERMQLTLENMRYKQKLDSNLIPAPQDKFKNLNVFVRPPKGLAQMPTCTLNPAPGMFDIAETFSGPITLHVLVRLKNPPKPKPAQPGQPAPPGPAADRGSFIPSVNALLAANFGAEPGATENVTEHSKTYKRAKFTAANGDTVTVYYYDQGSEKSGYYAALVWVIPPSSANTAPVVTGLPLTMGSFATGRAAANAFAGRAEDDSGPSGPAQENAPAGGLTF